MSSAAFGNERSPERPRFLVEKARQPLRAGLLPFVLLGGGLYAAFAWTTPLTSQSDLGVVLLTILFMTAMGFIAMGPNRDRLDLFRVMSVFYVLCFCIGPLFELEHSVWYLETPYSKLIERAAALALMAYVAIAAGYFLPLFAAIPSRIEARHERSDPARVVPLALLFWWTGFVFFWIFFAAAGGAAVILRGEGNIGREAFGAGIGILWWPLLWMTPGGTLYFAARATTLKRRKWVAAWPLVVEFVLLLLLQGRHRALGPLIMAMVISHYLIRPVRLHRLVVYGLVGAVLSIVIAEARSPALRSAFSKNPQILVQMIADDAEEHVRGLMTGDIGRLLMTMIVIDKVPHDRPYAGGFTLLVPMNPIFRRLGLYEWQPEAVGTEGYRLARPELNFETKANSGFLPSIVGEMRWNFPWPICIIPYFLYGVMLRSIYQRLVVGNRDFASIAIYAILGLYSAEMIVGTFAQNLFELADVVLPAVLVSALSRRSKAYVALAMPTGVGPVPER